MFVLKHEKLVLVLDSLKFFSLKWWSSAQQPQPRTVNVSGTAVCKYSVGSVVQLMWFLLTLEAPPFFT